MSRAHFTFAREDDTLIGTLDDGELPVGLLIVTGGNELRSGAFSGQALLAQQLSERGYPVLRFDRRGVGDSTGTNGGFRTAGPDIAAAFAAFRDQKPGLRRIVGYGLCDGAAALMLEGGAGCDALVLANPWTFENEYNDSLPPAAIRERYRRKLADPREWLRAARGEVSVLKLSQGLKQAFASPARENALLADMKSGLADFGGDIRFLVSGRDRTGLAFANAWGEDTRIATFNGADHAFSSLADHAWLRDQLLAALEEQARQLDMG